MFKINSILSSKHLTYFATFLSVSEEVDERVMEPQHPVIHNVEEALFVHVPHQVPDAEQEPAAAHQQIPKEEKLQKEDLDSYKTEMKAMHYIFSEIDYTHNIDYTNLNFLCPHLAIMV